MPSLPREQAAGFYHVTMRGVDRRAIFTGDETRRIQLRTLAKVVRIRPVRCHAFCQMDNHFHLVLETLEDGELAPVMQHLASVYARTFNELHARVGHLFERRYGSVPLQGEAHTLEVCRYVVLNPVRAGQCEAAEDWRWSNYRATVGLVTPPRFLTVEWTLALFDADPIRARVKYARFVADAARLPRAA